jgi:hypothetical protein
MRHLDSERCVGDVSSHRNGGIEVMGRDGRYKDVISHNRPECGVRGELSLFHISRFPVAHQKPSK